MPNAKKKPIPIGTPHYPQNPTPADYAVIRTMAELGCTTKEIAAKFNISDASFRNWRKADDLASEAYQKGFAVGNAKLRETLFTQATSGDPKNNNLLIFACKTRLKMSETLKVAFDTAKVEMIAGILSRYVKDPDTLKAIAKELDSALEESE